MAAPHPNLAGVEPLVSTRPADPRKRGEGTCPARGQWGTERSRHVPFSPPAGRRWRQPDEGQAAISWSEADRPQDQMINAVP
ncbi:hypothetical protein ELI30_09960 [Rhizobium leguminosarum]|uniref:Uncharacterized protein n=1 Tax=Rhizobium leguminosarum TaxID=384 RepID=A0ABD7PRP3_RHILE|nr:hypothetical protein ELI32_10415 [Rhizobium leguminosarum]TAV58106.1 hypothetical protein ELI31_09945 [Rhizobium leguminosarum]TAV69047.1 hypothetical protein ELI30_09960 [Rhizobium leguminosarum]TAV73664.1 hypothetical protein ELI28_09170 [Rhizobium leguminosarum]TAV78263.1 hypothetical protein ELI27_09170 [Rhizobium leguminosarum]